MIATTRLAGRLKGDIKRGQVAITLVNAADAFVERVRLHQLAANQPVSARPISDILRGTGVALMCGTVNSIDVARRTVAVQTDAGAEVLAYDQLVYALGSTIDQDSVPGVREHAYVLTPRGPQSAAALREVLPTLNANGDGRLLVCGGGATGIEAAAEFAEAYPNLQVELVTQGAFARFMNPDIAAYMRRSLERLGVTIHDQTTITEVRADAALTASGSVIAHDVCLWAGGFSVPPLARATGLAVNARGQIVIDPFMRSVSHPEIYAAGDAADPLEAPGVTVRMAAFTATVMGAHCADCLSAAIRKQQPKPLSFAYAGQAISLGQRDAIGFNIYPDDRPHGPYFTGPRASQVRNIFVRLLANLPKIERRWPGSFRWFGTKRYAAMQRKGLKPALPLRHD
jgi:NADH dehydrogenase FAD-containing subunit